MDKLYISAIAFFTFIAGYKICDFLKQGVHISSKEQVGEFTKTNITLDSRVGLTVFDDGRKYKLNGISFSSKEQVGDFTQTNITLDSGINLTVFDDGKNYAYELDNGLIYRDGSINLESRSVE